MKTHLTTISTSLILFSLGCLMFFGHNINAKDQPKTKNLNTPSPDIVYQQWVDAIISSDRNLASSAADSTIQESITTFIFDFQREDRYSNNGNLNYIFSKPTTGSNTERVGLTKFAYGYAELCYQTQLTLINNTWKVTGWEQLPTCPTDLVK